MILAFYPCEGNYNCATFNHLDWTKKDEAKVAFKMLYKDFYANPMFHFYNISTTSRSTQYPTLDDMVEDFNCDEVTIDGVFSIYLNLNDKDISDCIEEVCNELAKANRSVVGVGTYFAIIEENIEVAKYAKQSDDYDILIYNDEAECSEAVSDGDKGYIQIECKEVFPFEGKMSASVYGYNKSQSYVFLGTFEYDTKTTWDIYGKECDDFCVKLNEFIASKESFWYNV